MGKIKRKVNELCYRMKLRKELGNLEKELLEITHQEVLKEFQRRNKQK